MPWNHINLELKPLHIWKLETRRGFRRSFIKNALSQTESIHLANFLAVANILCVDLPHKVCIWDHVTSIRFGHPTLLKHAFDAATKIWDKYVSARFSCEKRGLSPPVMYYSFSVFVLLPLGHRTKDLRYHIRRHGLYSSLSSFSRYFAR